MRFYLPSAALLLGLAICITPTSGWTEPPPPPLPPDVTSLNLSATGSVQATPDQAVAIMSAENRSNDAALAQRKVNDAIEAAVKTAHDFNNIRVSVKEYSVYHLGDNSNGKTGPWEARQSIRFTADNGESLFKLVGQLQNNGMALTNMEWAFSPEKQRELTEKAELVAIKNLQARIQTIAHTLQLKIGTIQHLTIGPRMGTFPPIALMASPMSARLKADSTPQVSSDEQDITATVSATVLLRP